MAKPAFHGSEKRIGMEESGLARPFPGSSAYGTTRASRTRPIRWCAATLLAVALTAAPLHVAPTGRLLTVVVRAVPGMATAAENAVAALGGTVKEPLGIIDGFVARLGRVGIAELRDSGAVVSVTRDAGLHLLSSTYSPAQDSYSMYNVENQMGNRSLWNHWTGAGVDVALIDSGVSPVTGLNNSGQIIYGPDLTEESQNPNLSGLDTFGHGTFMAGIIAGHDPGINATTAAGNQTAYLGVAPDARIVSVKVADAMGMTDVSQVIAGIDWVVQHAHDSGLNIRVLNLSFGTDSTQSYLLDPLAYAAEVAWRSGIVVVVSAGNAGNSSDGLTMPAVDPTLLAVGAVDMHGQASAGKATIPSFSSGGDGTRNPDLVAPGVHSQGLRVPGSYIDAQYASTGAIDARYFRGSGTSEAAAYVSGSVAQYLQRWPSATPDQVKAVLDSTAANMPPTVTPQQDGSGILNIKAAIGKAPPTNVQAPTAGTGTGSLEASRGSSHLVVNGVTLSGERDLMGGTFNSASIASAEAAGHTWSGGDWNGHTWSGFTWSGNSWTGHTWSGNDWSGHTWSSDNWSSGTWTGSSWTNTSWSSGTWSGFTWSGFTWSGFTWSSEIWANDSWS